MAGKKKTPKSRRKSSDRKMMDALDKHFKEEYAEIPETIGTEVVTKVNVAKATLEYVCLFAANKNLYRSMPNLITGLRPGPTRMYYSWWELSGRPQNSDKDTMKKLKSFKVDKITTNSVEYHPHGTLSQDKTIGVDGQYWSNNVMLLQPGGSYGNMKGLPPGAGRYIYATLSEYLIDCFFKDFDKYSIPMREAYTGDGFEPEYLPSAYPHILFNPQFAGIGIGFASNIPPFNVVEVIDATIKLIKNPKAKILLYPDMPTGASIIDEGQFKDINNKGKGNFKSIATSNIDYVNNTITITSLPYGSYSDDVCRKISEMRQKGDKHFKHIKEIHDNTQTGEVEIIFILDNGARPDKILRHMIKKPTGLRVTHPVAISYIDDFVMYDEVPIKFLLNSWIEYRLDAVRSMSLNAYQIAIGKQHVNEAQLLVFANKTNIDKALKIVKGSKTVVEAKKGLMKEFNITSVQADTIASMRVYQFTEEMRDRFEKEAVAIKKELDELEDRLNRPGAIEEYVIDELKAGKKKYGRPRLSKIITPDNDTAEIEDTDHLIGITDKGWIKKVPIKNEIIGPVGKDKGAITVLEINNRESILVIDSTGNLTKINVSDIPDTDPASNGFAMDKIFQVQGDICSVMELPTMELLDQDDDSLSILFVTKKGLGKRVRLSEFKGLDRVKRGIALADDDEVAHACFSLNPNEKDLIIFTNLGRGIRLSINDLKLYGATAKGMSIVKLKKGEYVSGASKVAQRSKFFFFITSTGRGKITEAKYLPVMNRTDPLIQLINLDDAEDLQGVVAVNKSDIVMLYRKKTGGEELHISDMEISTRASSGTPLCKSLRSNPIIGFKVFKKK